jgi:hypothetical protein
MTNEGTEARRDSPPGGWPAEGTRVFGAIGRLDGYLASDARLCCPVERLFHGPIADALTHVGPLTMQRRVCGPAVRGENYFRAGIEVGRVGPAQAPPRREF